MNSENSGFQASAAKSLTIVVVEEDRDRAMAIVDALKDACDCDVFVIGNASGLGPSPFV